MNNQLFSLTSGDVLTTRKRVSVKNIILNEHFVEFESKRFSPIVEIHHQHSMVELECGELVYLDADNKISTYRKRL